MYDKLKNSGRQWSPLGEAKEKGLPGLQCRCLEAGISEAGIQASVEEVLGGWCWSLWGCTETSFARDRKTTNWFQTLHTEGITSARVKSIACMMLTETANRCEPTEKSIFFPSPNFASDVPIARAQAKQKCGPRSLSLGTSHWGLRVGLRMRQ